jgi:ubiquinone/menaquinone biosynthesis C-methylase UbiE
LEYEVNFPSILSLCPKTAQTVLDVGSGNGDFTAILAQYYSSVEGCDVSPLMVKIAQDK